MNQKEILDFLLEHTHELLNADFVENEVNPAFGTRLKCHKYRANPNDPKGLTLDNGKKVSDPGLSTYDIAIGLCSHFNVEYEGKFGRGSQVRACVEALRNKGYGNEGGGLA